MDAWNEVELLLVEDNATDAELCMRSLAAHNLGNRLLWVKDGAAALDFCFATGIYVDRRPDVAPKVVLLDLRLPKIDGLDVLRRLRADARTRLIPVVVLTSSKEDRDIVESYTLGANSFVPKPVDFDHFARVVGELGLYWLLVNRVP